MVAFFGGRPRFFFTLGSPPSPLVPSVAGGFGFLGGRPRGRFGGGVSPLSSFFSCRSKTECQHGVLEGSGTGVDYDINAYFRGTTALSLPSRRG